MDRAAVDLDEAVCGDGIDAGAVIAGRRHRDAVDDHAGTDADQSGRAAGRGTGDWGRPVTPVATFPAVPTTATVAALARIRIAAGRDKAALPRIDPGGILAGRRHRAGIDIHPVRTAGVDTDRVRSAGAHRAADNGEVPGIRATANTDGRSAARGHAAAGDVDRSQTGMRVDTDAGISAR